MYLSTKQLTGPRPSNRKDCRKDRRDGIVLLVVIAMLALFATVGLSFVFYSESVALTARYSRISVTSELRDFPPDQLLSQVLGQMIFGTDDKTSKFYGLSLGQNMYGGPGGRFAFSGTGFDLGTSPPNAATLDQYDTTQTPPKLIPSNIAGDLPEFKSGKVNAPYTFPDMNNPYLGAIDDNGNVIYRSYIRAASSASGIQSLRASGLPALPNAYEGDVKNLMGATSVKLPDGITVTIGTKKIQVFVDGTMLDVTSQPPTPTTIPDGTAVTLPDGKAALMYKGTTIMNDSVWMDPNIRGQTKEGISYKVLVAPFILDLDGRVNLATAGGLAGVNADLHLSRRHGSVGDQPQEARRSR